MKRFVFACYFVFGGLCQPISYAQDKTSPTNEPPETSLPEKANVPTVTGDDPPWDEETNKNPDTVATTNDAPFGNLSIEIAPKANDYGLIQTIISAIGLIVVGFATWFARGAWKVGRETLEETAAANVKSQRAYVGVHALDYHFKPMPDGRVGFEVTAVLMNVGQTPAFKQESSMRIQVVNASETGNIETGPLSPQESPFSPTPDQK